jgi:hypothetical protein
VAEIDNGSFEVAGATPGLADGWSLSVGSTSGAVATFNGGTGPVISLEQFDIGWGTDTYLLDPADGSPGTPTIFSDTTPVDTESFDDWNSGKPYALDVNTGVSMEFTSDTPPQVLLLEDFDEGWGTAEWAAEPVGGTEFEDNFDTGWSTSSWASDVVAGTDAMFDEGTIDTESFEEAYPDILFVADEATDVCTTTNMPSLGPPADDFKVTILTTGAYPAGIVENQVYYLQDVTTVGSGFTFKLSKTFGGSSINITDAGIGSHFTHANPSMLWTRFEE